MQGHSSSAGLPTPGLTPAPHRRLLPEVCTRVVVVECGERQCIVQTVKAELMCFAAGLNTRCEEERK
jgi:hypothetical protein